jgi:hypothetical protein
MKIVHTDGNGEVIPPAPKLPSQKATEPLKDTTPWGILKCGWGLFFLISGIASVVLDMSIPGDFPLFRGDSFTLGWLFIIGILIIPAACARHFGVTPLSDTLAVIWCMVGFVVWLVIHSITAEVDPGKPIRPNLALIGGLILCWRLLVTPRQEQPQAEGVPPLILTPAKQHTRRQSSRANSLVLRQK